MSSCSAATRRASSVTGLGTAPPNWPECRSTEAPRNIDLGVDHPAHAGADGRGVAADHAGVGDDDRVAGQRLAVRGEQRGEVRRARLLLALGQQLEVHGGAVRPRGGQVRGDAEPHHREVALVVGGAAPAQLLPHHLGARTARTTSRPRGPRAARRGGRRRARSAPPESAAGHAAYTAGSASVSSQTSTCGQPSARSRSASHAAERATSPWCPGSAEIDGIRSQACRSSTNASARAATSRASGDDWCWS